MNLEFKVGTLVHFHAYAWYDPQLRIVAKVTREPEDRVFYHLRTVDGKTPVNVTTGRSIVESKLFVKPVDPQTHDWVYAHKFKTPEQRAINKMFDFNGVNVATCCRHSVKRCQACSHIALNKLE
jgi:hypothetical protein